jgi:cold shock CspA family protein
LSDARACSSAGTPTRYLASRLGTVSAFDEQRGLGVVTGDDRVEHPFHCVAIADGTRNVVVGARVRFNVVAGRLGNWEAARIEKLDD